jgi:hypothetical protein
MQSVYETRARDGHFRRRKCRQNGPLKALQNDKGNKQAHNYLLIVHFDTRSSRNGKNPHSRARLLTLYKTICCCWSFQSFRFRIESSCPKKNMPFWEMKVYILVELSILFRMALSSFMYVERAHDDVWSRVWPSPAATLNIARNIATQHSSTVNRQTFPLLLPLLHQT